MSLSPRYKATILWEKLTQGSDQLWQWFTTADGLVVPLCNIPTEDGQWFRVRIDIAAIARMQSQAEILDYIETQLAVHLITHGAQ